MFVHSEKVNETSTLITHTFSSLDTDITNTAFSLMDIEPRVCREKAVCEAESLAGESYMFGSIMKFTR